MLTRCAATRTQGRPAVVGWTRDTYAKMVGAGHKIVGYPETMVFAHPSNVGAIEKLRELKTRWETGEIFFADATADDKRRAVRHPRRVVPGKRADAKRLPDVHFDAKLLPSSNVSRAPDMSEPRAKEVVLRPVTLVPAYELPIDGASRPGALARMQRSDTKKSRGRKGHGRRRGITTESFVLPSPTKGRGGPSASGPRAVPTSDRIDGYESMSEGGEDESDAIEDASGWDAAESDPIEEWIAVAEGTGKWKRKVGS